MAIDVDDVQYTKHQGGGSIEAWIAEACRAAGVTHTDHWIDGYKTLCRRESSYNPNAVNLNDSNNAGTKVADGHPMWCSRGIAQCIPPTFAAFHAAGTSNSIYDPVANIAASIRYVRSRYNVAADGSDLAKKVQQADPARHPRGYILSSDALKMHY